MFIECFLDRIRGWLCLLFFFDRIQGWLFLLSVSLKDSRLFMFIECFLERIQGWLFLLSVFLTGSEVGCVC